MAVDEDLFVRGRRYESTREKEEQATHRQQVHNDDPEISIFRSVAARRGGSTRVATLVGSNLTAFSIYNKCVFF